MNAEKWKHLLLAAIVVFTVHLVAALSMAIVLRQGLDSASLPTRIAFLINHPVLWIAAWVPWTCAALAILAFFVFFVRVYGDNHKALTYVALTMCCLAVVMDISAEWIETIQLPRLALEAARSQFQQGAVDAFKTASRQAVLLTGCYANAFYTLATAVLVFIARAKLPGWISGIACVVVAGGIWLSVAAWINSVDGMVWSNVVLLPALLSWTASIAYVAYRQFASGGLVNR